MSAQNLNPSSVELPRVVAGTASLGNLFVELSADVKKEIISEYIKYSPGNAVFDTAGKYGAGLALETLGKSLNELNADKQAVAVSNKLGWYRTELKTPEPTFEKGVWMGLKHDAVQMISYDGIIQCFEQGNELLNGWASEMVSVHDPDEYLQIATSVQEEAKRYDDVLSAYTALSDLKAKGKAKSVGIGAKDWRTIIRISKDVKLDWIMIANSMTIKSHPAELLSFMADMEQKGVTIINSAIFHSGFLIGGDHYDYKPMSEDNADHKHHFEWRKEFFDLCESFNITPASACTAFALNVPGVKSIALSTTDPKRVKKNIEMAHVVIPDEFWLQLAERGLIEGSVLSKVNLV